VLLPELEYQTVTLSPTDDNHPIVIITGHETRHRRFALRIIQEFGDQVLAWYEIDSSVTPREQIPKVSGHCSPASATDTLSKIKSLLLQELPARIRRYGITATLGKFLGIAIEAYYVLRYIRTSGQKMAREEARLWGHEIEMIERHISHQPTKIHPNDVHTEGFIAEIRRLDPYFLLTLSGPLYREPLLSSIRGAAINQHAGHSPDFKGSYTIQHALYQRRLDRVSSTVHITRTGADSGEILRRTNPCLFPEDTIETVFLRTVGLGTELMIESVREIMVDKQVMLFKQPKTQGQTYLGKNFTRAINISILRDFSAGWLRDTLNARRTY
jgi:folate-dependent phosphoribosylglycinamide formyltransferase PurN